MNSTSFHAPPQNDFRQQYAPSPPESFPNLDWNQIWQQWRRLKSGNGRKRDWERRAGSFARNSRKSSYARNFIAAVQPEKNYTVLDIGCGPGTLAIPLSPMVQWITAIDKSEAMIGIVTQRCREEGIKNVTASTVSWEDDWNQAGIGCHDLVIASRSLVVDDLEAAITKMSAKASKQVVIASLVGDGPYDRRLFEAIGRRLNRGPDYLCAYNLLNQMGILASVSFIASGGQPRSYRDLDEAVRSFRWMTGDLDKHEKQLLYDYISRQLIRDNGQWTLRYQHITRWALISWRKETEPTTTSNMGERHDDCA